MPESLEEKLDRHLRSGLEGPGEVRLGELYVAARDEGASRTRSWRLAVEATDDPQVQRRWADWERIHDQGELALRLRALVEHQSLDEELADFLMFFFRASAPGLYRPAALAVGRHAGDRPELIDRLEEYAARFDVDLDQSIALNGERSRRRLLLAAAGRAAVEQRDVPVEEGAAERLPAESGSDLSVLCRAVAHLLEAGRQPGHLVQTAWTLLGDLERHAGTGGARRSVAREWGVLLRALADRDADRAAREWADELRRIAHRRDDTYAPKLTSLWEFDTLVSSASAGEVDLVAAAGADEIGELVETPFARQFARVRLWQWQQREGAESTAAIRSAPVDGGGAEPALDEFVQEIPAAVASGAELSDAMHRWIGRAVERLGDAPKWWSSPPRSRAVRSLLLLDAVRQRPPPRDALVELFRSAGVMDPATASTTAPELGVEGMPWAGYHDLLWSLYLREGAPADFPVESETLTSMTSAERLLGFLRAGEASRDTDILVDAVEHFVRLELASDSDFDHRDFLYRLASRKPSEGFVREFAERTSGRTYPRTDDSVVELERELDQLAGEIAAEAEVEADPVGDCRWFPELGGVRRRLAEIARLDDTAAAVAAFADQLDPRIPDPESHARGLVDIVDRSAGASGRVLLDSSEPEMDVAVDDLVEAVSADLRVLRESAETMFQSGTGDVSDVHRAGRKAVGRLEAIERRLVPCIAEFDAELLAAVVDELRDRIGVWLEVFERDVEGGLAEPEESGADAAEAIFERVLGGRTAELSDADQARLCRTAYAVVEAELGGALPPEDDAVEFADWRTQRGLLDAAARATDEEASPSPWMEFLAERWQRLADVAMSAQSEPSVIDLVADPDLRALRRCASDSASVEALEDWLMDRFQFGALAGLSAERRGKDGAGLGDYLRGAERTARNFTHVWLALMVGAVMILDFGDAWVELARQRDLVGIGVTSAIGVGGTFVYVLFDLTLKTQSRFEVAEGDAGPSPLGRALGFVVVCFVYTVGVTSGLWYLFSGTELVLHGASAGPHILVWTGFALFVGVFFGLLTESA